MHDQLHAPNRFAVIPTSVRLNADAQYTGKGVTIAFLDSGFYAHPDQCEPANRILFYEDVSGEQASLETSESWQWHGRLKPCSEIVSLLSESMDRRLTIGELLELRIHLFVCAWCARYLKQIKFLRQALRMRSDV